MQTNTPSKKRIMIGMAIGDGSTRWETSMSLMSLIASGLQDFEFVIVPMGGCDVAHARNLLIHAWRTRHSDCGKLLFIDSDVKFTADDILRVVQYPVGIVGGLYPRLGKTLSWSYNGWLRWSKEFPELWEVVELCTGFMCIDSEVINTLAVSGLCQNFTIEDVGFRGETATEFFWMGTLSGRRYSEDFYFCKICREVGYKIYADSQIQLDHIKTTGILQFFLPEGKTKFGITEMVPKV